MKLFLMILLVFNLIACSGSKLTKDAEEVAEQANSELADEVGLEDESGDEFEDEFEGDEEVADETSKTNANEELAEVDQQDEALSEEVVEEDISPSQVAAEPASSEMSGEMGTYTVKSGDTLMLISFKLYGDYKKWRKLVSANSDRLGPNNSVIVGAQLQYEKPAQEFVWNPDGNPYLIRSGDTLGSISTDTYGTPKHWKDIWKNNEPLIQDPNRIFAGFTIYTPLLENRDVASEDN